MNLIKLLNEQKTVYDVEVEPGLLKGFFLGLSSGNALISKIIEAYSKYKEKIPYEYLCSHTFTVFDGTIYESTALGNQERHISKYIKEGQEFWVFRHPGITEKNYIKAIAYAEGALGRVYDYPGIIRFLFNQFPQLKYGDFCSEYSSKIIKDYLKLPFIDDKPENISPSRILKFCSLESELKKDGWKLYGHYDDGKKLAR